MEAEAKHDFVPSDINEMPFNKGDIMKILNYGEENTQWYDAEMGDKRGIVPGNYININVPSWYRGKISRSTAEALLQHNQPEGAFLVRLSESSPSDFSLSVKCGSQVQHFRILKDDRNQYFLWTSRFSSLNKLIDYYRSETVSRTSKIYLTDMIEGATPGFLVRALYDFDVTEDPEADAELAFKKGEIITVFDSKDENWWGGRIGDREGYFPKLYVTSYVPGRHGEQE